MVIFGIPGTVLKPVLSLVQIFVGKAKTPQQKKND
jgi:hypothetical protein